MEANIEVEHQKRQGFAERHCFFATFSTFFLAWQTVRRSRSEPVASFRMCKWDFQQAPFVNPTSHGESWVPCSVILNPHRSSLLNFSKLARLFHRVKRRTWSPESPSGFYPPCSFYCDLICSLPEFLILREALPNHAILSNTTTWELLWVPSQVSLQSEILFFFFKFSLKKKQL